MLTASLLRHAEHHSLRGASLRWQSDNLRLRPIAKSRPETTMTDIDVAKRHGSSANWRVAHLKGSTFPAK